ADVGGRRRKSVPRERAQQLRAGFAGGRDRARRPVTAPVEQARPALDRRGVGAAESRVPVVRATDGGGEREHGARLLGMSAPLETGGFARNEAVAVVER